MSTKLQASIELSKCIHIKGTQIMCNLLSLWMKQRHLKNIGFSSKSREFGMAVSCRFLVPVALLLLYFASATATGRSTKVEFMKEGEERAKDLLVHTNEDKKKRRSDELVAMDYTPASRRPPIHN